MIAPIRLTVVLTHPIQYYAPWFRHIQRHAPDIDLTVVHATQPTPEQQGVGFGQAFEWDLPLTEGYRSIIVRPAEPGDRIDTQHFTGLDVPEIGRAIADTAPDVVLINGWYSVTLIRALIASRRLGAPVLWRGDSHLQSGAHGWWRRGVRMIRTRVLLSRFEGFLSPGVRTTEYLSRFGVAEHKIFRVPHGVDNAMFAASAAPSQRPDARAAARRRWDVDAGAFVPMFVGKLVPSKRPAELVRAAAMLGPDVTVMIVGAGPLEAELRAEGARQGVDLRMIGFVNQSELGELYAIADCLALPSAFPETWGLVVNEALATGLPCVVSSAVGCAPDLIRDGETGYVFPLDDIVLFAEKLSRIRERRARGHDWGPACRAHVSRYSFEEMTAGLARACRSVLPRSRPPEPAWRDAPCRVIACCGQMVIAGGLERMTFEVLNAVRVGGGASHAIVNGWENFRITRMAEETGVSWSVGPYWYPLTRRLTPASVARMAIEVLRVSANLLRVSRRIRPTHVFVPDFEAVLRNAPALFWLRARGVRVIMRLGNAPSPGRFYERVWRHLIDRFVDRFVVNSDFTRRELVAVGISGDKVRTIANMPARRPAGSAGGGPRIPGRVIFVGQIIPEKGLDLLLDAVGLVRAAGIDATLDVVGSLDGWESPTYQGHRSMIRERVARPDLAGAVSFLGWREDVPALLGRSSLHCCPSRPEQRESFGNVVLEAKVSGLPSVVTTSGSLPEVVAHRRDGWVCTETTAEALAEGIGYFLSRPEELARASRAARASASEYSEERFASAWLDVFAAGRNG